MLRYIKSFREASYETKQFVLTTVLIMLLTLGATVYAYLRLPADRSGPQQETEQAARR